MFSPQYSSCASSLKTNTRERLTPKTIAICRHFEDSLPVHAHRRSIYSPRIRRVFATSRDPQGREQLMTVKCVTATFALILGLIVFADRALAGHITVTFNGRPTSDMDNAMSVAIDPATGSIFVGGRRQITSTESHFFVVKYDSASTKAMAAHYLWDGRHRHHSWARLRWRLIHRFHVYSEL